MSFSVNTNVTSLQAQNTLRQTGDFQSSTIQRVTSGLRIVASGDDAAGLAIANGFRSDLAVLNQGIRNANDGLSTLQTLDGGMNNISKLLDRARTLATQSASGTFTGDRGALNTEFQSVMTEIDRQAQAIGMNQGGMFATSMSVFIGGGRGTSAAAALENGAIALDLSKSTVDTKSLNLNTYRVMNGGAYSLSPDSATSVSKIIAGAGNATTTDFFIMGAGFNDSNLSSDSAVIKLTVDLTGVSDAQSLATTINQAIKSASNPPTATTSSDAFKASGISASVITDAQGNQRLAFTSNTTAFQVHAGDAVSGAFLGNFADTRSGQVRGQGATVASGDSTLMQVSSDLSALKIDITDAGGTKTSVTMASLDGSGTPLTAQAVADAVDSDIQTAGLTDFHAELKDGKLMISSASGQEFTVKMSAAGLATALGFSTAAAAAAQAAQFTGMEAGGTYQSTQEQSTGSSTDYSKAAYLFAGITGGDSQTLTISAQHSDGSVAGIDVLLDATTGADVTTAVDTINAALKDSNDPSLTDVVAVRDQSGIRFLSTHGFNITLGTESSGGSNGLSEMVNGSLVQGGTQLDAATQGAGGMVDIASQSSAADAVSSLAAAVQYLGQAQATVGKGENQFSYAINLAQSQVSNIAAAESRIRDADLAAEAANMSKAQILMQAGVAALAQANSAPQQILSLLKGS